MNPKVQELLEQHELPLLSNSVARLAELNGDEDATLADFEGALLMDPALCASVLRLANSASFGRASAVESIEEAVRLLGSKTIYSIGTSAAFARVLPAKMPGYHLDANSFWRHSIAVAVLTEDLLKLLKVENPSLGYVAGLLHDIGKMLLDSVLDENADDLQVKMDAVEPETFVAMESAVAGIDHCELGAALVKEWRLPTALGNVARYHHEPAQTPDDQTLVDAVHFCDGLAHMLGFGADIGELLRSIDPAVCKRLGITEDLMETLTAGALARIESMTEAFSLLGK